MQTSGLEKSLFSFSFSLTCHLVTICGSYSTLSSSSRIRNAQWKKCKCYKKTVNHLVCEVMVDFRQPGFLSPMYLEANKYPLNDVWVRMCADIIWIWMGQFVALITTDKSIWNAKTLNTVTHGIMTGYFLQQSQHAVLRYFEEPWFWETMKSKKAKYIGYNKLY